EFKGDAGQIAFLRFATANGTRASRLLLIGAGDKDDYKAHSVATVAGTATRFLRKRDIKSVALMPRGKASPVETAQNAVQGFITSQFELDKYKTKDKNNKAVSGLVVGVAGSKQAELKAGIERGRAIGESMNFTRDLANE